MLTTAERPDAPKKPRRRNPQKPQMHGKKPVIVPSADGLQMWVGLPPATDEAGNQTPAPAIRLGDVPPIVIEVDACIIALKSDEAFALGMSLIQASHEAQTQAEMATFLTEAAEMTPGGVRQMLSAFSRHRYLLEMARRGTPVPKGERVRDNEHRWRPSPYEGGVEGLPTEAEAEGAGGMEQQ